MHNGISECFQTTLVNISKLYKDFHLLTVSLNIMNESSLTHDNVSAI